MKWFKKHPDYLREEARELRSNSNYKEKASFRENLLVSCGEIIVRSTETKKYPILIVYPESTPYSLPAVYLLYDLLSEEEVETISKMDFSNVAAHIKDKIRFYNRRHQGSEGTLCLVESDSLYSESAEVFPIRQVIDRVRHWLSGLNTGRLPPDSPEVELFAHFKNKDRSVEFLLPEMSYDDNLVEGILYAALTTAPIFKRTYIGVTIYGKNRAGIVELPKVYENKQHLLHIIGPQLKDILTTEISRFESAINYQIKDGTISKIVWFEITCEPEPFEHIEELAFYIGEKDIEAGYRRIFDWLGSDLKNLDVLYLGIRFPGRTSLKEWQIFILRKKDGFVPLFDDSIESKKEMINNCNLSAVYSEAFTESNYHKRNSQRADRDIFKSKRVTIIGCGALGSEVADDLAKAGVGRLHLVDKELFRAHNSIRHLVSIDKMGLPKALVTRESLILHNPFVTVTPEIRLDAQGKSITDILITVLVDFLTDILTKNINEYLLEESIGISTIADNNVERYLNEQAIIYNKTIFYARALRGGKTARIFRVIPGKDACMNCLAYYCQDKDGRFINIPEDETLPTIANECNNPIRPASAADLKIISSIASRLIIDYLQKGEDDKNHWIFTTEKLEGIDYNEQFPYVLYSSSLLPHPNCIYCKKENPVKVLASKEVLEFMQLERAKDTNLETGGILLGYKNDRGDIVVTLASEPGPKAIKESTKFERDPEYCQRIIDDNYEKYGDKSLYVGEWHYHSNGDNKPSNVDLLSLSDISKQKEYLLDKPIMIILSNTGEASCTVHPFNKQFYSTDLLIN
jgi:integrative and conjugative element protein (TIGR02256 family)